MCVTWTSPKFYFLPTDMRTCTKPSEAQSFGTQLLKKCPAFSDTARLIAVFTGTRHWSPSPLPRSGWIHFTEYFCKDPIAYFLFIYSGTHLLKKYPAFYGTAKLIAANGRIGKRTTLVPPLTQMNPFHYVFQLRSIWILFSPLYQCLPRVWNILTLTRLLIRMHAKIP
jgi:hypothetical protein